MGKKNKRAKDDREPVDTGDGGGLTHNPFAALQGGAAADAQSAAQSPAPDRSPAGDSAHGGRGRGSDAGALGGKIVLRRETKGRGGKTVTRVEGLPADRREEVAHRMKKGLGCGAKVEGDDVLLQGSLVDRAADWLAQAGARRVVKGN